MLQFFYFELLSLGNHFLHNQVFLLLAEDGLEQGTVWMNLLNF